MSRLPSGGDAMSGHPLAAGLPCTRGGRYSATMSQYARLAGLAAGLVALAVAVAFVGLAAPEPVLAEHPECEVHALGELSAEADTPLTASGRWTTEDCDSRFRAGSDAYTYSFEVAEGGRVRIDLASAEADSFLYLMAADGSRIDDNDDGAAGLDARIERMLEPGSYLVEATTVGGRGRGPAGFSLSIARLSCAPIDLGALVPGTDLTASGTWTIDTCGSQIVSDHPAYNYTFVLPEPGRVRIELLSEHGDPVLSLASPARGVIGANDDGADGRGARIEQYLLAGPYAIEATTYLQRDLQPLVADFTLVVHLVDEAAAQQRFLLKIEESLSPDEVVAGEPFAADYRLGNLGGGDLPADAQVIVYAVAPRVFEAIRGIPPGLLQPGSSYHSSPQVASADSLQTAALGPLMVALPRPGPSWVFVAVIAFDADDEEIAFHGLWRNVRVVSGPTFGPAAVTVEGADYLVVAVADDEGMVTTWVVPAAAPGARVDPGVRARAIYAAAVRSLVLDGAFERPATADPVGVSLADASSGALLRAFAERYVAAINAAGVAEAFTRREALSPLAVEDLTLSLAATASAQYAYLASPQIALKERVAEGAALSFAEARQLQVSLAYAERVLEPAIAAGELVSAARSAELGWDDPAVRAGLRALARLRTCDVRAPRGALEAAGVEEIGSFVELHRELHATLPAHALAVDAVLCGVAGVDRANASFLGRLDISDPELTRLDAPEPAPEVAPPPHPPPEPLGLRIIARLAADGRVEHGVEFAGGGQILPAQRFLGPDVAVGRWHMSSEIEVGEGVLGRIRARWLADGRIEWGFRDAGGAAIVPDVRFLPQEPPAGRWFRSTPIDVTPVRAGSE